MEENEEEYDKEYVLFVEAEKMAKLVSDNLDEEELDKYILQTYLGVMMRYLDEKSILATERYNLFKYVEMPEC